MFTPSSLLLASAALAVTAPALLARNTAPSSTFLNQALALVGWAIFVGVLSLRHRVADRGLLDRARWPTLTAGVLMLAVAASFLFERLPFPIALSAASMLVAACLVVVVGAACGARAPVGGVAMHAFCVALAVAGIASGILAMVQVFVPGLTDGDWIARASTPGRASGNLRQPNHLSSLLLWAMAAMVLLHDRWAAAKSGADLRRGQALTALVLAGLIFADVLTVSRTGTACIVLLALWGVVDRRLSTFTRRMLWLAPFFYALCWFAMSAWARSQAQSFAGDTQLHKSDLSSSRFAIWSNTVELIKQNPWFGVGWGEFNFAWSLTPFPDRPVAFFDHTHNLPLNLLVELGIPLGSLVIGLLAWSLWKAFTACRKAPVEDQPMVRAAFVMVLMMVVHSMLEYPLWYAYFLLPTAFALGICLGHSQPRASERETEAASPWPRRIVIGASLAVVLGTVGAVFDYLRVSKIFVVDDDDPTPLSYRIAQGQKSIFFAHHADYAAATVATHPSTAWTAFRRAPHLLLDTRLMMAWAKAYAEKGDIERARYIADRLREFRNPDSAEFFAECDKARAAGAPEPFQCQPATRAFTYQDFKLR